MAKRGYRGKHPYNDMKVEIIDQVKVKSKLTKEYENTKSKFKYDYIKSHYFHPQGSVIISGTEDLVAASHISMSSHGGEKVYMKGAGDTNVGNKVFKSDGTHLQASTGIVAIVNASSELAGSVSGNDALITSRAPGPEGNTEIVLNAVNVAATVTFNGVAASNSGSLFFIGG